MPAPPTTAPKLLTPHPRCRAGAAPAETGARQNQAALPESLSLHAFANPVEDGSLTQLIGRDFDQGNALESRPVVFRLRSVGSTVKDTLIINAADIYGLDQTIVKGEADALSDVRSENHCHFVRCHPSQFYVARSDTQIPSKLSG